MDLPHQTEVRPRDPPGSKPVLEWGWDLLVLGIGGSALGTRALHQALVHPQHNRLPMAGGNLAPASGCWTTSIPISLRHPGRPGPAAHHLNVISKSGATAETLAQFLWVYQMLKNRVGEAKARERIIVTTDPDRGPLRRLASREALPPSASRPVSAAAFRCSRPWACCRPTWWASTRRNSWPAPASWTSACKPRTIAWPTGWQPFTTCSPPGSSGTTWSSCLTALLAGLAEWFCQLWAESLGKAGPSYAGSTPVRALGTTDQHSQLQLYMQGPPDKLITFVDVEKYKHQVAIPNLYPDQEELSYLGDHSLGELLRPPKSGPRPSTS